MINMITIEKNKLYTGRRFASEQLSARGQYAYYKIFGTNRFIAIENGNQVDKLQVVIRETKELPLYRQAMEMQMGRVPRPTDNRRVYNLAAVNDENIHIPRYEVYNIIYGV